MQIIIDIPEEVLNRICFGVTYPTDMVIVCNAIHEHLKLPKGHGRLGDLDALYQEIETKGWFDSDDAYYGGGLEDILLSAPTIIEADKEVDE